MHQNRDFNIGGGGGGGWGGEGRGERTGQESTINMDVTHLLPPLSPKSKQRKVDSLGTELINKDSENRKDILSGKVQPQPKAKNIKLS